MGMAVHGGLRTFSATAAQLQVDAGSRHPLFSEITRFSALPQGSFEPFADICAERSIGQQDQKMV
jgi:hypothetical protein